MTARDQRNAVFPEGRDCEVKTKPEDGGEDEGISVNCSRYPLFAYLGKIEYKIVNFPNITYTLAYIWEICYNQIGNFI